RCVAGLSGARDEPGPKHRVAVPAKAGGSVAAAEIRNGPWRTGLCPMVTRARLHADGCKRRSASMVDAELGETGRNVGNRATLERPIAPLARDARFGSDVAADTLRALDIPYIALNPGASFRGLHDSLVNRLGNDRPRMLLCLHEEHAVAIAHGCAKGTGRAMAAGVHSNVGLMHAPMAVFNAWCDRMPVLLLGATGPVDAEKRRPWIDWIHTARDQGALVRGYVKWDDQPASPGAAREALVRAKWLADTPPQGPVYINLDAGMQEAELDAPLAPLEIGRLMPPAGAAPKPDHRQRAGSSEAPRGAGWSRFAHARGLAEAGGADRARRRARHHRPQARRRLSDGSSSARGRSGDLARCGRQRGAPGGRPHCEPRLGRFGWHDQGGLRQRLPPSQGHAGVPRSPPARGREYGLSGPAARRPPAGGRARCRGGCPCQCAAGAADHRARAAAVADRSRAARHDGYRAHC